MPCDWLDDPIDQQFQLELEFVLRSGVPVPLQASFTRPGSDSSVTLSLDCPLMLERLCIPKPWGQEIWYTGVEQRGVCQFEAEGGAVPIPWVLAALSSLLSGGHQQLVLLKILDPLAAEVWGDLYFELHEEKREVYVVTHVDAEAWPDGVGAIRFGFDADARARYHSDAEFKAAFRQSVASYEAVRRDIDAQLDRQRESEGIALDAPVSAAQLQLWQEQVPAALLAQEKQLRAAMEAFSHYRPLRVGDVVKVPLLTPHALQHGVRTVEFQTPVYERRILSFAQKVLTQGHWDTDAAIELMTLAAEQDESFHVCHERDGVLVERIVDFDDFEVERWRLDPGSCHQLDVGDCYAIVMQVDGELELGATALNAEQACLLPNYLGPVELRQRGQIGATALVARPK